MASEKNITMRQYNGVDYDTLYPKTKVEQVEGMDGYFTNAQTLSSDVASLFGLSGAGAIPNNVFNQLYYSINGTDSKLYQWNRWKWSIDLNTTTFSFNFSSGYTVWYIAQFDSITFNKDGSCTGQGRQILSGRSYDIPSLTSGKYYGDVWSSASMAQTDTPYFYNPSNGSIYYNSDGFLAARNVFKISSGRIKTTGVVTSTDPNAYIVSDTPDAEGWFYEKLPDIQLYPPLCRFVSSSYIGTGTSGSSNKNTIVLPFNPKMVIISQNDSINSATLVNPSTIGTAIVGMNAHSDLSVTWGDKQVSWYGSTIGN